MKRIMRTATLLLGLTLAASAATPGAARASDQDYFQKLITRNVLVGPAPFSPFRPKGACLCNSVGSARMPGFLALYPDGTVYCLLPDFDATGTVVSYGACTDFAVLGH